MGGARPIIRQKRPTVFHFFCFRCHVCVRVSSQSSLPPTLQDCAWGLAPLLPFPCLARSNSVLLIPVSARDAPYGFASRVLMITTAHKRAITDRNPSPPLLSPSPHCSRPPPPLRACSSPSGVVVTTHACVQAAADRVPRGDFQRRASLVVPVLRVDLRHGVRAEGGRVRGVAVPDAERVRAGGVPVSPGLCLALWCVCVCSLWFSFVFPRLACGFCFGFTCVCPCFATICASCVSYVCGQSIFEGGQA